MEVKKIKNILTAIGNPVLNNQLKKIENLNVIKNDIQYQEGIFEILEINKEINFLIISQLIPGKLKIDELIDEIQNINSKIKIILILENYDKNLERILIQKGVYRIFYDNKIEIKDIIKIINEDEKMEKYNEEIRREIDELKEYIKNDKKYNNFIKNKKNIKNNVIKIKDIKNQKIKKNNTLKKYKKIIFGKIKENEILNKILNKLEIKKISNKYLVKNIIKNNNIISKEKKIISILGNNGAGKSIFSIMLAKELKNNYKKILIIDFDILNNSLHTILGVKKYSEKIENILKNNNTEKINIDNLIININKKIDLISGINLIFDSVNSISKEKLYEVMEKIYLKYDAIIIDTTSECFFDYTKELINISNKCIYLTEANLLELSKSRRILDIYKYNWNIENNKINILFNKFNKNSIDMNLLEKLYSDYNIIGNIKLNKKINILINKNLKNIKIKNIFFKKQQKIIKKIS